MSRALPADGSCVASRKINPLIGEIAAASANRPRESQILWCAIELFRRLDRDLWETSGHNPVLLLGTVDQDALETAASDDSFLAHMRGVADTLKFYVSGEGSWYSRDHGKDELLVAYFSAEFGITECLSIFSGGLGVLAGDHLKAASDLGLPLIGVGYQQGYFRQYLNGAGWQQEAYSSDRTFEAGHSDGSTLYLLLHLLNDQCRTLGDVRVSVVCCSHRS